MRVAPPPATVRIESKKNAGLAAVLSFFFVGLGQIYNGQIGKGIGLMILGFVCVLLMIVVIGFIAYPLLWLYGIYDAYKTAEKINRSSAS